MSPLYRILLVAAHAAFVALIAFPRALPSSALARPTERSPSSRTMDLPHVKGRSVRILKSKNSKVRPTVPREPHSRHANVSYHYPHSSTESHILARAYTRSGDINFDAVVQQIDILNGYYSRAYDNAQTLEAYSSQAPPSRQKDRYKFEQKCASALTDFHTNSQGFTTTLRQLGADKGRAHYNEYDDVEKLVKEIIDLCKRVLDSIAKICNDIPYLYPVLGPIVYNIKCILDEILDALENLTDAIIGDCEPLLKALVGEYSMMACKSGINVVGICLGTRAVLPSPP
ncbi:hypothetical protein F5148DRAFT_1221883 [Russula earlei]|uniref:Uncharacterized protein n=1 Tax=Russula earlei TaxID=71964 RepID=A0ACC0U2R8_9AGAM|nr:hypothetical protein F5148DRAFT_1221883 [Russula earlei]